MKRNMKAWMQAQIDNPVKKAMPIISYPSIQKMGITVKELVQSSDLQAKGMKMVADLTDSAASVSLMDLSVEAEAFGATIDVTDDDVPNVIGCVVKSEEDANQLEIPKIGTGRTKVYIEAVEKAVHLITDRPVFGGVIGPFSLAGRLMDVTEIMYLCFDEPEMVHTVLDKVTKFLVQYMNEYKKAGANGIMIAEPLAGLLGPAQAEEFSADYIKKIVEAVQDDEFIILYHNCGNSVVKTADSIFSNGCMGYHFGNSIQLKDMLEKAPKDRIVMGNVDPAGQFLNGTVDSIYNTTTEIMKDCCEYKNFIISSGCDVPPLSSWDNIQSFFKAVNDFYG